MGEKNKEAAKARAPGKPLDARVRRSREVVLQTASELLIENGVSGLSVDEVARRSGVAKTTIYRHWRTRADLVLAACGSISTMQHTPDSGTFEADLTALLSDLARSLEKARWPLVLPSIVDAAERDGELAALYSRQQQQHAGPYLAVIERAKKKGQLPSRVDAAALVAQLLGPLFYRRWFSREPLDDRFVKAIVKSAIRNS